MRRKLTIATGILTTLLILAVVGCVAFLNYLTTRTPGEYFDSNGAKLYYTVQGEGEPIVLIHGMAAQADLNWRKNGVVDLLAKDYQVITFDLRGHGLSEASHDPAFYGSELVEDVPRLLDHLGIEKAHVAGYSLGGFIALKLVATHPDRVHSAALCAAGWKDPSDPADLLKPYLPPKVTRATTRGPAYASVLPLPSPIQFGFVVGWVRDYLGDRLGDKKAFKACKKNYLELGVPREELTAIATPTICFMGTQDGLLPYGRALRDVHPATEYIELEGANHVTTAMRDDFKTGLKDFFHRHPMDDIGE